MPELAPLINLAFFDPAAEYTVVDRRLPHWSQAGTISFLTWRTWDSVPESVAAEFLKERARWLADHGVNPNAADWRERLAALPPPARFEFASAFSDRWQSVLDDCRGSCPLRAPELAELVATSLRHFDGTRYRLTDFVVMPNHVHLLVAFPDETAMLAQCESWKHFTAVRLNKKLGRTGRFWQTDGFDHLVRSEDQLSALKQYIADNPWRAGLHTGEYVWYAVEDGRR
jgi:putative transposase